MIKKKLKNKNLVFILGFFFVLIVIIVFSSKNEVNEVANLENDYDLEEKIVEFDASTIVVFEDENLENYIREKLDILSEDIYASDMLDIYDLNINRLGVTSLVGLEYASNLNSFTISYEDIESLKPLRNLVNLKRLSLRYSNIEDLPISFNNNVNLTNVSIVNTAVNDLSFLANMTELVHLTATDANIVNISDINNLSKIKQLNLRGNEIEDISVISEINDLEILNLQKNKVFNVESLTNLKYLDDLVLSFNPIYNISPLININSLNTLVIYLDHDIKHHILNDVKVLEDMGVSVEYNR